MISRWWWKFYLYKTTELLQKIRYSNKIFYIIYVRKKQIGTIMIKKDSNNKKLDIN